MCGDVVKMWWYFVLVPLIAAQHHNHTMACQQPCLRCSGANQCVKCPQMIVFPTRDCVTTCPYGHSAIWSTRADYMGRMCVATPLAMTTVLAGVLIGCVLSAVSLALAAGYIRHRRRKLAEIAESASESDDGEFHKQLQELRPHSQHFLDMLNDARRQLRESRKVGDHSAIAVYRPVLRDLAKVLILVNRSQEAIGAPPDDWEQLFAWARKALKRFKRMSDTSIDDQLIDFSPSDVIEPKPVAMSTFKPDQVFGSGSLNPQWKFEYSLINNDELWKGGHFFDDEFLGFRPQDEITTEL